MIAFIDDHRDELGVEPICEVLQVATSTYYAAKARPLSARSLRDAAVGPQLLVLWEENYRVYGARKLWKAAGRAGIDVGRDQVACLGAPPACGGLLAHDPGLAGGEPHAHHHGPRCHRDGPLVTRHPVDRLRCHSDAGSQFTSLRYGERLAEIGAQPSIGTVGDSYDNALAETVNGYDEAEVIRGPARRGPWKSVEEVELVTLAWVHRHNTSRLHGYLGDVPSAEFEAAAYAATRSDPLEVELQTLEPL